MGGIAPVRQSDRLVGFTAEARARRYLAPRPARNAVTPLPHIPWRSHPYVRSSSVGLNARIVPLLLLRHNVASGTSDIDPGTDVTDPFRYRYLSRYNALREGRA